MSFFISASPQYGSWACSDCWGLVEQLNKNLEKTIPFALRKFLKFAAGKNPDEQEEEEEAAYTPEMYKKVQITLRNIRS